MSVKNITPIAIFSDLLDGYSASRIADDISLQDHDKAMSMAYAAIDSFRVDNPTAQDQKNVHAVLNAIFDGSTPSDLVNDHSVDNYDLACDYINVIQSDYSIS